MHQTSHGIQQLPCNPNGPLTGYLNKFSTTANARCPGHPEQLRTREDILLMYTSKDGELARQAMQRGPNTPKEAKLSPNQ